MHVFEAAQPALLYIVPACIAMAAAGAASKGKLSDLWAYTEEQPEEEGDAAKSEESKKGD